MWKSQVSFKVDNYFIMVKRQKWKLVEDQCLMDLVLKEKGTIKWDVIAHQMKTEGFVKSSKQCRERWMHQLDPELNKEKWTQEENLKLFQFHNKIGNQWKKISEQFPGRTDNAIKNNFFSLIRKSLRTACKVLGKVSNTAMVNQIKPKVLSDFITRSYEIKFPEEYGSIVTTLKLNEFVKKFAFNKFPVLYSNTTKKDIYVIEECINFLLQLNNDYQKGMQRKKKIKKKIDNIQIEPKIYNSTNSPSYLDQSNLSKARSKQTQNMLTQSYIQPTKEEKNIPLNQSWVKPTENSDLMYNFNSIQKLLIDKSLFNLNFASSPIIVKKKLIEHFGKIRDFSHKMSNIIFMASQNEIEKFLDVISVHSKSNNVSQKQEPSSLFNVIDDQRFFESNFRKSLITSMKNKNINQKNLFRTRKHNSSSIFPHQLQTDSGIFKIKNPSQKNKQKISDFELNQSKPFAKSKPIYDKNNLMNNLTGQNGLQSLILDQSQDLRNSKKTLEADNFFNNCFKKDKESQPQRNSQFGTKVIEEFELNYSKKTLKSMDSFESMKKSKQSFLKFPSFNPNI